ncbi:MAG: hypothetical protein ABIS03_04865 [Gemmatimonadaceae bacterium]
MILSILFLAASACAEPPNVEKPRAAMSDRERNTTIANSNLPGAKAVKRTMEMADKQAGRIAEMDSTTNDN